MSEPAKPATTRQQVTLKIKFKSQTLAQFIERYAVDVSRGGIFIRTKDPLPVGTPIKFEFQLQTTEPLIAGEGVVQWIREPDATRHGIAPGMGLKFEKLSPQSHEVLDKILAQKQKASEEDDVATTIAPVPASPAPLRPTPPQPIPVPALRASQGLDSDETPLPRPFAGAIDDWSEDKLSEPTRVASLPAEIARGMADEAKAETPEAPGDGGGEAAEPAASKVSGKVEVAPEATEPATPIAPAANEGLHLLPSDERPEKEAEDRKETATPPPLAPAQKAAAPEAKEPTKPETKPSAPRVDKSDDKKATSAPVAPPKAPARKRSPVPMVAGAVVVLVAAGGLVAYQLGVFGGSSPTGARAANPAHAAPSAGTHQAPPPLANRNMAPAVPSVPVQFDSTPPGATVAVEGLSATATTPGTLDLPEGKEAQITVHLDGWDDYTTTVTPRKGAPGATPLKVDATLGARRWEVKLTSFPPDAHVIVDGKDQGRAPYTREFAASGLPKTLQLESFGYVTQTFPLPATGWTYAPGKNTLVIPTVRLAVDPAIHHPVAVAPPPPPHPFAPVVPAPAPAPHPVQAAVVPAPVKKPPAPKPAPKPKAPKAPPAAPDNGVQVPSWATGG